MPPVQKTTRAWLVTTGSWPRAPWDTLRLLLTAPLFSCIIYLCLETTATGNSFWSTFSRSALTSTKFVTRLTVKDVHGASNTAQAWVTVIKETDYPPEANAGQDVIIYLPQNALTLNGNQSKDDRGISSWEWTKNSTSKAVDMQVMR